MSMLSNWKRIPTRTPMRSIRTLCALCVTLLVTVPAAEAQDPNFTPACSVARWGSVANRCQAVFLYYSVYPRDLDYYGSGGQNALAGSNESLLVIVSIQTIAGNPFSGGIAEQFIGTTSVLPGKYALLPPHNPFGAPPPPKNSCKQEEGGGQLKIVSDVIQIEGGIAVRKQTCGVSGQPGTNQDYAYTLGPVAPGTQDQSFKLDKIFQQPPPKLPSGLLLRLINKKTGPREEPGFLNRLLPDILNGLRDYFRSNMDEPRERCVRPGCIPARPPGFDGGGVRGSFTIFGFSMMEGSPAFIADTITLDPTDPPYYRFVFAFDNVGDGDWLEVAFDSETIWAGLGTDFIQGEFYEVLVPSASLRGRTGFLAFALHSTGDEKASVFIGDPATLVFDDEPDTPVNQPPTADAGPDRIAEATGPLGAMVTVDGSASSDPEHDALSFMWEGDSEILGTAASLTVPRAFGPHTFTVVVVDDSGNVSSDTVTVVVADTTPPSITSTVPSTVEATSPHGAAVFYTATATDAVDPNPALSCAPASGSTLALGAHTVTCTAMDASGNSTSIPFTVHVQDMTPPTITDVSTTSVLFPPNHKMVPIAVGVRVTDIVDPQPQCRIVSVSSNEPDNGLGDGDLPGDWVVRGALLVDLRAERSGRGTGRIYTVWVECTDASGNSSAATAMVRVPHDQKK